MRANQSIVFSIALLAILFSIHANAAEFYVGRDDPFHKKTGEANCCNQSLVERLNSIVHPPRATRVDFFWCGSPNAYYLKNENKIIFCHELMQAFGAQIGALRKNGASDPEVGLAVMGARYFVLFHEAAHALILQSSIAISGREEDVADQLAIWLMYKYARQNEDRNLAAGIADEATAREHIFYRFRGAMLLILIPEIANTSYADEHAFNTQRFANMTCWLYGADPLNPEILSFALKVLPPNRIEKCRSEWQQIDKFTRKSFKVT